VYLFVWRLEKPYAAPATKTTHSTIHGARLRRMSSVCWTLASVRSVSIQLPDSSHPDKTTQTQAPNLRTQRLGRTRSPAQDPHSLERCWNVRCTQRFGPRRAIRPCAPCATRLAMTGTISTNLCSASDSVSATSRAYRHPLTQPSRQDHRGRRHREAGRAARIGERERDPREVATPRRFDTPNMELLVTFLSPGLNDRCLSASGPHNPTTTRYPAAVGASL
jgi:hypothetical protein